MPLPKAAKDGDIHCDRAGMISFWNEIRHYPRLFF